MSKRIVLVLMAMGAMQLACSKAPEETASLDAGEEIKGAPIDAPVVEPAAEPETDIAEAVEPSATDEPSANAEAPAEESKTVAAAETIQKDGMPELSFDLLGSFTYQYPDLNAKAEDGSPLPLPDQVPAKIKAFDGKKVLIEGFMLPSEIEKGKIKSFVLLKDIMGCCFGVVPMMNEWVFVKMEGDKTCEFTPDVPIKVEGTLEVGEEIKDNTVMSLYRLIADKVHEPSLQKLWDLQQQQSGGI